MAAEAKAIRTALLVYLIWMGTHRVPQPPKPSPSFDGGGGLGGWGVPASARTFITIVEDATTKLYQAYVDAGPKGATPPASFDTSTNDSAHDRMVAAYVAVVAVEAVLLLLFTAIRHEQQQVKQPAGGGRRHQSELLLSTLLIGLGGYSLISHVLAAEATLLLIALVLAPPQDPAAPQFPRSGSKGKGAFEALERGQRRLALEDSSVAPPTSCIVVRVLQVCMWGRGPIDRSTRLPVCHKNANKERTNKETDRHKHTQTHAIMPHFHKMLYSSTHRRQPARDEGRDKIPNRKRQYGKHVISMTSTGVRTASALMNGLCVCV